MSNIPSSGSDWADATITQPIFSRQQSPRKRRLSNSSYCRVTVTNDDSNNINSRNIQTTNDTRNELNKLPTDEHHNTTDIQRRDHLNYLSELYYQNSPVSSGSPLSKNRNDWMTTRRTSRWVSTIETPRPLDFSEALEPSNNYNRPSLPLENEAIKRQRTSDLFTPEASTTDGSWTGTMTPLVLRSSQTQPTNQEQEQVHSFTPSIQCTDTQHPQDLSLESPRHNAPQERRTLPFTDNTDQSLHSTKTNATSLISLGNSHSLQASRKGISIDDGSTSNNSTQNNVSSSTKPVRDVDQAPYPKMNDDENFDSESTRQQTVRHLDGRSDEKSCSTGNIDRRRQQLEPNIVESHLPVRQKDITEAQFQLDLEQQLKLQHVPQQLSKDQQILEKSEHSRTAQQAPEQSFMDQCYQKQEHLLLEESDRSQQSTQCETRKDTQNCTGADGKGDMEVDHHHTRIKRQQHEMDVLMESVKKLRTHYRLLKKVGCGTFSSVYKAQDMLYDSYDNTVWEETSISKSPSKPVITSGKERETSTKQANEHKYVALKQIYSTSSPKRMVQEIKILKFLRGAPYVCQLITAFRSNDHVFLVMPYFKHYQFDHYYRTMNLVDTKYYMIALLTALKHLHRHRILHRDIKPHNFLYEKHQKTGVLIDFGLAQLESETKPPEPPKSNATKLKSTPKLLGQKSVIDTPSTSSPSKSPRSPRTLTSKSTNELVEDDTSRKPGFIKHDQRKRVRASRAGTRGFRAPEVLLRVTHQTIAIDIWSVGVILLSLLSGRFPFFLAHDESDSLIEIASIFGMKEMKDCAALHNRTFETNIGTIPPLRKSLSKLCQVLNTEKFKSWAQDDHQNTQNAIDLLEKMLTLNYKTRITAEEALKHPFLSDTLP